MSLTCGRTVKTTRMDIVDMHEYRRLVAVFAALCRLDDEPNRANFARMLAAYVEAREYYQRPVSSDA
jgi:hypothetical protein